SLHRRRNENELGKGITPAGNRLDIVPDGASVAGDNTDASREAGQGTLARLVEQPFGLELLAKAFHLERENALSLVLEHICDELEPALLAVVVDMAVDDDAVADPWTHHLALGVGPPHRGV